MIRIISTFCMVMICYLAACSGSDPLAPDPVQFPGSQSTEIASLSESKSALDADGQGDGTYWGRRLHGNEDAFTLQTIQNAYKFERALWRYIEDNGGEIPRQFVDTNLAGKTLYDYLPGKKPLRNPFTMLRTEPQLYFAASPGEVGYVTIQDDMARYIGFIISAFGTVEQVLEIIRYLPGSAPLPIYGPPFTTDASAHR